MLPGRHRDDAHTTPRHPTRRGRGRAPSCGRHGARIPELTSRALTVPSMTTKIRILLASVLTAAIALPFGSSAVAAPAAAPTRAPAGGSTMVDVVYHDPAANTYVLHGLTRSYGSHVLITQKGARCATRKIRVCCG